MKTRMRIRMLLALLLLCTGLFAGTALAANTPAQVKNLRGTVGEGTVTLKWNAVSGAHGYSVWQSREGGAFKKVAVVKGPAVILKKLSNGVPYKFYVCAYKTVGANTYRGKQSNTVALTPKPVNPGKVNAKLYYNGNKKVTLSWDKVKYATSYQVWQKKSNGKYALVGNTTKLATTITGLTNNVVYTFRVRAVRTIGKGTTYGPLTGDILARPTVPSAEVKAVHRVHYWATFNQNVTVTSYDGKTRTAFNKGQKVRVTNKNSSTAYLSYNGKEYRVNPGLITCTSMITDYRKAYSGKVAQEYVNYKGFTSTSNWFVWVNTYTQHVYVFKGSQYRWKLQKDFVCSTGMLKAQTSYGFTYIRSKQYEWWFTYDQLAYYASRIGCGAFHSWLYYPGEPKRYYPGIGTMGYPASHGCVRIDLKNAKYMYENVPPTGKDGRRTTVFIW